MHAAHAEQVTRGRHRPLRQLVQFGQARKYVRTVAGWGTGVGLALAVATMLAPRWGAWPGGRLAHEGAGEPP